MTNQDSVKSAESTNGSVPVVKIKKGRGKRKYTGGFKDVQITGFEYTEASGKVARAVSRGIKSFIDASDRSGEKRRDGAIRDLPKNASKALGKSIRAVSKVPYDLAKGSNRRSVRRLTKRPLKVFSRFTRGFLK